MKQAGTLSPRHFEVLHAIVQNYIDTGEPVASRTIARHHTLSSASIRNMMADLTDEGYLSQPHTSAGRVPTERGFQSYAKNLGASRIVQAELDRLRADLQKSPTVEDRIERSSKLLTELTRQLGIAAAIPSGLQTLDQIELMLLPERRVLMVIVTRDKMVRHKVVRIDDQLTQDELTSIRNYVNYHFSGWLLPNIHRELKRRLELESAAYDAILKRVSMLYSKGLLDLGLAPEIHFEGVANLIGLDLHLTREKMLELFHALEEKKRILQLLDRFLEQPHGEPGIQVGLADAHPSMRELSLIGIRLELPDGLQANVAVLGPMRMNYAKSLSAVLHVSQAFKSATV
jgi:heat-inducible transcriptional repressor